MSFILFFYSSHSPLASLFLISSNIVFVTESYFFCAAVLFLRHNSVHFYLLPNLDRVFRSIKMLTGSPKSDYTSLWSINWGARSKPFHALPTWEANCESPVTVYSRPHKTSDSTKLYKAIFRFYFFCLQSCRLLKRTKANRLNLFLFLLKMTLFFWGFFASVCCCYT